MPELIVVLVIAFVIWPVTRICSKASFSPWLGLLTLVPVANVPLLWFLAIAEWPRDRRSA
jgi:hypothetical protein